MKKTIKAALSLVLCACMLVPTGISCAFAASADKQDNNFSVIDYLAASKAGDGENEESDGFNFKRTAVKIINAVSNLLLNKVVLGALSICIPKTDDVLDSASFKLDEYADFYAGTETFIDENTQNSSWNLGYAQSSIIPDDFGANLKYARGSYVPWWYTKEVYADDEGNPEDLKVRTIVMNDGTGRGSVAFSVIDCIGISNADVRKIRAALSEFAAANNIVSINVSATHTHSGIDSQGVWTKPLSTVFNNVLSKTGLVETKNGVDETFLQKIIDSTSASVKEAYNAMQPGELFYAKTDISDYLFDRTPPYSYDGSMYRLTFHPYNESAKPTLISTFGCHPESSSYDWLVTDNGIKTDTKVSGDFVYYMEKVVNKAGYNFIYIQGNVGTVSSRRAASNDGIEGMSAHDGAIRYGYEMGYIALGIELDEAGCKAINDKCGDLLGVNTEHQNAEEYTVWYDGHTAGDCVSVKPVLNIRMEQVMLEMENNMAKVLTKTGLASNRLIYDSKTFKYYTVTEIGYMEVGDALKVFLTPGEVYSEMLLGGEALEGFSYPSLREKYGDNMIICDLMNDAAGYISPDNNYVIAGYQYNEEDDKLESDTWCLLVSMGKNAASDIIGKFIELVDGIR